MISVYLVPVEDIDPVEPGSEPPSQLDTPQSGLQRPRRLVVAWLAAISAYILLVPSGLVGQEASVFISDVAWTTAALLATISCLRAAKVSPGRERVAWLLFAAACGAWTFGQFAWNIYEIFLNITVPFPSLADVGYLGFGPLMIAGLLVLRTTQRERALTWLRIANLGLILSGIAVLLIVTLTQPFLRAEFPVPVSLIVVGESASITIAFILSLYVLWSYRWGLRLGPVALLTLALALHTISGLFYTRELVTARYDVNSV